MSICEGKHFFSLFVPIVRVFDLNIFSVHSSSSSLNCIPYCQAHIDDFIPCCVNIKCIVVSGDGKLSFCGSSCFSYYTMLTRLDSGRVCASRHCPLCLIQCLNWSCLGSIYYKTIESVIQCQTLSYELL